ncbi:hypothetical protein ACEPAG_4306 [Sanghuangporus baumii]
MHNQVPVLFTPLTPPPDAFNNSYIPSVGSTLNSTRPRPHLHIAIGRALLRSSPTPHSAALAFDTRSAHSSLPITSSNQHAFRYARDLASSSGSASAPSGGDHGIYTSSPALEHSSDAATLATSVSGYPCSPPPSRHHSEHAANRDKLSGASHFSAQSPASSPPGPAATSVSDRLNLTSINAQTLPDHYQATFSASTQSENQSEQRSHLTQAQQHPQASLQPRTSSSLHSPSDRFPSLASMLSSDRYPPRIDRYAFPAPNHERRISDPSDHYSTAKIHPSSMAMGAGYGAPPSYTLHRVERTGSYPEIATESGLSQTGWREDEKEKLYIEDRARAAFDPYSPIHSSFSSSNSSIATQALPSPHYYPSRGYTGPAAGTYPLYGPSEDAPYDARPQTGSSDSSSPSYPYPQGAVSSGSRGLPNTLNPHQADYANFGGADPSSKTYSFVALPGNTVRKRPRRRYDEIERLYACNFPGCTKAYGTLNHLNAHVNMQKHGPKRHPNEFKEMRKQWRKMKKEQEAERERLAQLEGMPGAGNSNLSDVMRRRRVTDPSPYGIHGINPGEDVNANGHPSGSVAASVSDPLGISSLDASSYGLSQSLPINVGSDPIGSMGVGTGYGQQQQYSSSSGYHGQQRPSISPASPSGPSDTYGRFTGSGQGLAPLTESPTNYYTQSAGFEPGRTRTPPPRNQLPPDATLCSAYTHSQQSDVGGDGYALPSLSSATSMDQRGRHGSSQ